MPWRTKGRLGLLARGVIASGVALWMVGAGVLGTSGVALAASSGTCDSSGTASGQVANGGNNDCNSLQLITKVKPSSVVTVGTAVYDTAQLSGSQYQDSVANGSGSQSKPTISYTLYSDRWCQDPVADLTPENNQVTSGSIPQSKSYTFTSTGTWYFGAAYSGGRNGPVVTSDCKLEPVTVQKASPSISTKTVPASPVTAGTSVYDTATLTGATATAGGTVTYKVYSDAFCRSSVATLTPTNNAVTNGAVPDSTAYVTTAAGKTLYFKAIYSGDAANNSASSGCSAEPVTVQKADPAISTETVPASPVVVGTKVYDTATLTGATSDAGGKVTYGVYSDSSCKDLVRDLTPEANSVVDGTVPDSLPYTFNTQGTYYFQATYSGDANNQSATSKCCSEAVVVKPPVKITITTKTVPSSPVTVGTPVYDTATLGGLTPPIDASLTSGVHSQGYVTYKLYKDSSCNWKVANLTPTSNSVVGGEVPSSLPYTFTSTGTWYFQAAYFGSNGKLIALSSCRSEKMVVQPTQPSITTKTVPASPVTVGTSVYDTAALTGATSDAGGKVTYGVYSDSSCKDLVRDLTPEANSVVDGTVPDSVPYTFNTQGTYYFQAVYSGDSNNDTATSICSSEPMIVQGGGGGSPTITTATIPSGHVAIGTLVYDTASLSGPSSNPPGTVTYKLYSDSACTDLLADLTPENNSVTQAGVPNSDPYTFTSAGTYYFQAEYNGQGNNAHAISDCTAELVVVDPNHPTIATQLSTPGPIGTGTNVYDTATLTGATGTAGGTVTYMVYSDSACSAFVADVTPSSNSVVNGVVPNSKSIAFTTTGTYYFQATYNGDHNNFGPVSSQCASEAITVTAPAGAVLGASTSIPGTGAGIGPGVAILLLGTIFVGFGAAMRRRGARAAN